MKVVHFSETPLSSAPYRLMQVQNEYGMKARLVLHKHRYTDSSDIIHPYDILLQDGRRNRDKRKEGECYNLQEIESLIAEADVLHFHNFLENHFLFKLHPHLLKYLSDPNKKVVFQVHSPRRNIPDISKSIRKKYLHKRLVIAQFQALQFRECEIVPNAIPINDELHMPTLVKNYDVPSVVYSPSNTKLKGWNNKGEDVVERAIGSLGSACHFKKITETPFIDTLIMKRKSDICIDEVMTGSYHMSSLEAMSMGLAVINGLDADNRNILAKWTGTLMNPMIHADPSNLTQVLQALITRSEYLKEKREESRAFMEKYWSIERQGKRFEEIYS